MEFLEVPLFDDDLFKMLVRFAIDVFFLSLIVFFAVYPNQKEREFAFTAVMMNVTVFFICFALKKLDLGIGMALGLFAIFGVLRYRTDAIRTKEMTYLFIVIGIGVINALSNKSTSYAELAAVNLLILGAAILKERIVGREPQENGDGGEKPKQKLRSKRRKHTVEYDKLEWLGVSRRADLLADLQQRTGIQVADLQIRKIDLKNATATIEIWTADPDQPGEVDKSAEE